MRTKAAFKTVVGLVAPLMLCLSTPAHAQVGDAVAVFNKALRQAQKILKPQKKRRSATPQASARTLASLPVPPQPLRNPIRFTTKTRTQIQAPRSRSVASQPAAVNTLRIATSATSPPPPTQAPRPAKVTVKAEASKKPLPPPDVWTEAEIADAQNICKKTLARVNAVVTPVAPIKKGGCGDPAPVKLSALKFNGKQTVQFKPAATVNCQMVLALDTWIRRGLQPLAQKHLGSPITTVSVMSSYSCRNRYGRKKGKLSEHGKANALDIGGFHTADGARTQLLADWGPTERDIVASKEKKKKEQEKAAQATASTGTLSLQPSITDRRKTSPEAATSRQSVMAPPPASEYAPQTTQSPSTPAGKAESPRIPPSTATVIVNTPPFPSPSKEVMAAPQPLYPPLPERRPSIRQRHEWTKAERDQQTLVRSQIARQDYRNQLNKFLSHRSNLGGPKKKDAQSPSQSTSELSRSETKQAVFLRGAHSSACRIFGTVLGPEANDAHRNHFHIDLAPRRYKNYCE